MLLILAILPIVVTVGLGVFAGLRHQFAPTTSDILIQLVMHYALPLSLFGGILSLKRATIIQNSSVALWLALGMLGGMVRHCEPMLFPSATRNGDVTSASDRQSFNSIHGCFRLTGGFW